MPGGGRDHTLRRRRCRLQAPAGGRLRHGRRVDPCRRAAYRVDPRRVAAHRMLSVQDGVAFGKGAGASLPGVAGMTGFTAP